MYSFVCVSGSGCVLDFICVFDLKCVSGYTTVISVSLKLFMSCVFVCNFEYTFNEKGR